MKTNSTKHIYKKVVKNPKYKPKLLEAVWSPEIRDWRDMIEDYIDISKKRLDNKLAMFHLQMNILTDLIASHDGIRGYKKFIKNPESAQEFLPKDEEIDDFHINYWNKQLGVYTILSSALKEVGDGILWRALSYNRSLIYVMSANESSGLLNFDTGLNSELKGFMDVTNERNIKSIVFHGITNFGKIGDVTCIDDNDRLSFLEIKSGENVRGKQWKERMERQNIRGDNLSMIANEKHGFLKDKNIVVREISGGPNLRLKDIRKSLFEADNNGISTKLLYNYLGIIIVDNSKLKDDKIFKDALDQQMSLIGDEHCMFDSSSIDNMVFSHNRTPLSIYPMEPRLIADVLLGKKVIFYHFNIKKFTEELKKYKWEVIKSYYDDEELRRENEVFCILKKGALNVAIPLTIMPRVMYEGLDIKSILRVAEHGFKGEKKDSFFLWDFEEEKNVWN